MGLRSAGRAALACMGPPLLRHPFILSCKASQPPCQPPAVDRAGRVDGCVWAFGKGSRLGHRLVLCMLCMGPARRPDRPACQRPRPEVKLSPGVPLLCAKQSVTEGAVQSRCARRGWQGPARGAASRTRLRRAACLTLLQRVLGTAAWTLNTLQLLTQLPQPASRTQQLRAPPHQCCCCRRSSRSATPAAQTAPAPALAHLPPQAAPPRRRPRPAQSAGGHAVQPVSPWGRAFGHLCSLAVGGSCWCCPRASAAATPSAPLAPARRPARPPPGAHTPAGAGSAPAAGGRRESRRCRAFDGRRTTRRGVAGAGGAPAACGRGARALGGGEARASVKGGARCRGAGGRRPSQAGPSANNPKSRQLTCPASGTCARLAPGTASTARTCVEAGKTASRAPPTSSSWAGLAASASSTQLGPCAGGRAS